MKAITDEIRNSIAKVYMEPIIQRLSETAREQVIENFCILHCGKSPGEKFCSDAEHVYQGFLAPLFKHFSQLN